jgi:hypothetical protein
MPLTNAMTQSLASKDFEIMDRICDLLQLCDRLGFDPEDIVDRALMQYEDGKGERGGPDMKMNSRPTPGPWEISHNINGDYILDAGEIDETAVIFINEYNNGEANARLIVAAPELLEELIEQTADMEDLLTVVDKHLETKVLRGILDQCRRSRAAIAKAKGTLP